jgi:mannosylglycerate hydrolase
MTGGITTIHLVPHTHWDREWYEPFQVFRMRLVELVDGVLDMLEREPSFRFTLDGQLATIDDYLEVRPGSEERIRRLVDEGRLAIGPWQILMDEFLVSGETIVRNLQTGTARAQDFGGAMNVGYLPDMFGHVAQMPQILRRAGIDRAVVWRGVPASVTANRFRWRSPDGSEVATEYLVGGYGNGAHIFDMPAEAAAQAAAYARLVAGYYGPKSVLAMYGTDHMLPRPDTAELVGEVNRGANGVAMRIETLAEYIAAAGDGGNGADDLTLIDGEMRSGARANMLMGVNSAHLDIKAAAAHAERWLTRYAEPISALFAAAWPERILELAWARVIDNSAHDSICGCSVDAVTAQVLVRFAEAEQIARGLTERALAAIGDKVPRGWRACVNPSPHPRAGLVELDLAVPDDWPDVALETADGSRFATQELSRNEPLLLEETMSGADAVSFLDRRLHNRELFGKWINAARTEGEPRRTLVIELDDDPEPETLDLAQLRLQLVAALEAEAERDWLVRVLAAPRRRLRALVDAPALGWTAVRAVAGAAPPVSPPVEASEDFLGNGLVSVRLAADGSLAITRDGISVSGVGRLVDGGDAGDSYNYGPPARDAIVDQPVTVSARVAAGGPLVGELIISRTYDWPIALAADRRSRSPETVRTPVATHVQLRAGEPFVRITVAFDNQADDHRLRFHVPLPTPAERSAAEGQFAVVERGLTVEGGHGEMPLATFPAYGFVAAGGMGVLLDHVTEYELIDGRELALTCLRSIGWISRNDNPYREDPAGPERAVPASQMRGRQSISFALLPHAGEWPTPALPRQAEDFAHNFMVATGRGRDASARSSSGLAIEGDYVVMTALLRRGEWLELRLVNESGAQTTALVSGGITAAREADLHGRPGPAIMVQDGSVSLRLGPAEIRTIHLQR